MADLPSHNSGVASLQAAGKQGPSNGAGKFIAGEDVWSGMMENVNDPKAIAAIMASMTGLKGLDKTMKGLDLQVVAFPALAPVSAVGSMTPAVFSQSAAAPLRADTGRSALVASEGQVVGGGGRGGSSHD